MKKINFKFFLVLFIVVFIITASIFSQTMPMKDKFYIGYQGSYYDNSFWNYFFPGLSGLNVNFIQNYGHRAEYGDALDGGFKDPLSLYITNVRNFLTRWGNTFGIGNNALFMEREKVYRAAYGQLSDYQAEFIPLTTHPQYGYANRKGAEYDTLLNGETIRGLYAGPPDDTGYWLISGLIENREQISNPKIYDPQQQNHDIQYYYSDVKDSLYRWFVLPRMRIDTADASLVNPKKVCRIVVIPYNGDTSISSNTLKIDLSTNDFRDANGNYTGQYIDLFYKDGIFLNDLSIKALNLNRGNIAGTDGKSLNPSASQVDYRIYWYGQVNLWLDRVRVEDSWAFHLFHPDLDSLLQPHYYFKAKIKEECDFIGSHLNFGYFYIDEYMYNSLPCIAQVDSLIKQYKPNSGLIAESNISLIGKYSGLINDVPPDSVYERLVSSKAVKDILFMYQYPFTYKVTNNSLDTTLMPLPPNVTLPNSSTYPGTVGYYKSLSSQYYNDTLNYWFENDFESGYGHNYCIMDQFRRSANLQKNHPQIMFCAGNQSHSFEDPIKDGNPHGVDREPTNEEIRVQNYLALAYGARIILNFCYPSSVTNNIYYNWGMDSLDHHSPRNLNYYNQRKYDTVKILNANLQKIGKLMYEDNNLVWDDSRTVDKGGASFKYFNDLKSYFRNTSSNWDCSSPFEDVKKYWEIGVFNNNSSINDYKYFVLVNKRCTPEINWDGDVRQVRLYFDLNQLPGFNNWALKDMSTNNAICFDKNNTSGVVFPYDILPGEGKLFQLAPVMKEGGTLVCNEEIGSGVQSFECKGEVIGNGKNISIPNKVIISFHPEGKITMNGGQFICGQSLQKRDIVFQGFSPFYWNGFEFNSCSNIDIRNCKFTKSPDVPPGTTDYIYSLKITNSNCIIIKNCEFDYTNTELSGAVKIDFAHNFKPRTLYIANNNFNTGVSTAPIVNITSYTSNIIPVLMEYNTFTAPESDSSNNAIILSNITGGAIKNNIFTNYLTSVKLLSTSLDFYKNTITCNRNNAIGINCLGNSFINMSTVNSLNLGGENIVTNLNDGVQNVAVSNSMFYIQNGYNYFNLTGIENGSFHLKGYFPREYYTPAIKAIFNCFNKDGNINVTVYNITWGISDPPIPVVFNFYPSSCTSQPQADLTVFELDNHIYDTVRTNNMSIQNTPLKMLYDSININVRKNDYQTVISQGYTFLNNYADSLESIDIISKLYLASLVLDSSGSKIQPLMSYFESLIQNYLQDTALISRAYYFIQKCKVAITDYQSALTGFQDIMNQNPYTYEGLLASWDYSATTLLLGGGGGESNLQFSNFNVQSENEDNLKEENDLSDKYIDKIITQMLDSLRKDRKTINTNNSDINQNKIDNTKIIINRNVESVFEGNRKITENRIKDLEKKIKSDNEKIRKDAVTELIQIKKLGEAIKVRNPKDIAEHIKFVNRDIKKVFGGSSSSIESKKTNIIPTEFALRQNYPNPFNPVTKISFDLPKDSKVKLIVYDILGREITRLLNSEFRPAGKYVVEFNAVNLNLASGVYFYRIETDKFSAVKKMLMIK